MSAIDAPPNGPPFERSPDYEWFRALERKFIALRGAPLQLSADDYRVARAWRQAGIPLDLVLRVLEDSIERQRQTEAELKRRLRYYGKAVEAAWKQRRDLQASATQPQSMPVAVLEPSLPQPPPAGRPARLERLAAALPKEQAEIAEQVRALGRRSLEATEIEDQLAALDDALLDAAALRLDGEAAAQLDAAVAEAVSGLQGRVPEAEIEASLPRLRRRLLRRQLGLPVLSLLSPEALGG